MRTVYKVTVEANVYDDNGDFVRAEALYEGASPRPEALLRTAPTEVEDALRDLLPDEDEDGPDVPAVNPEGHYRPVDEAATAPAAPKTRKRRTKAEIAADKAAAEAAKALPAAPVEAPVAEVPPAETAQPAAPVAVPESVPAAAAPVASATATPLTTSVPVAAPPPAEAPWNPFQQR